MSHGRKKRDVHMIFYSFLYSGIPDTALGILKMLIRVCFQDLLQPAVYEFANLFQSFNATPSPVCTLNVYTVFTVCLCSLQVLAVYKKVLS